MTAAKVTLSSDEVSEVVHAVHRDMDDEFGPIDAHLRAALESLVAKSKADAWDEGLRHGMTPDNWSEDFYTDDNPYREYAPPH